MDENQYSLTDLRDIVIPDSPPFWPPASGVWVALAMLTLLLLVVGWRIHADYRKNAYRRAGLALLEAAGTSHEVSVVLKRVALAAFPREQVASLYGDQWSAFLRATGPADPVPQIFTADSDENADPALIAFASTWIRHHRDSNSKIPGAGD